jgi:xanthine dehydrogenase accessory factor
LAGGTGWGGMNHWKETAEILTRLAELAAAGRRAALATVIDIVGSAYRRPGAKFLIEDTGGTLGGVSGGCLEADVREVAKAVVASGRPSLRHYNTGDEDVVWGLGLGCNGLVDVFVQPATEGPLAALAGRLRELFAGDSALALATVVAGGEDVGATLAVAAQEAREPREPRLLGEARGPRRPPGAIAGTLGTPDLDRMVVERVRGLLAAGRSGVDQIGECKIFVEVLQPPPHLVVCGAGEDARPLVAYATDVGFRVTLFDHRPALLAPAWFPQAARRVVARPQDPEAVLPPAARGAGATGARSLAVVKTHSLVHDREWVRRLLAAGFSYIGVLGPRGRTEAIVRDVLEGFPEHAGGAGEEARERVFGPVGLDLGADGPRQVAISIVAELLAFTARREPRHLAERREAIHAR